MIEFDDLNAEQKKAVLHALKYGAPVNPGQDAYVILSMVPQYLVQGTFASRAMAERIRDGIPNQQDVLAGWNQAAIEQSLQGWSPEERRAREIVHVVVPASGGDLRSLPDVMVDAHPDWTNCALAEFLENGLAVRGRVSLRDVTNVTVTVTLRKRRQDARARKLTARLGPRVDSIFLTRGAHELFVFPAFKEAFGEAYVDALRARLGLPLRGDEAREPPVGP